MASKSPDHASLATSADQRRLIQLQLVLLLHAEKCQNIGTQTNGEVQCSVSHCLTMKQVLVHRMTCQAGKSCTVPHCCSSNQILDHWKNCVRSNCPVCSPLKEYVARKQWQTAAVVVQTCQSNPPDVLLRAYAGLGLPFEAGLRQQQVDDVADLQAACAALGLSDKDE